MKEISGEGDDVSPGADGVRKWKRGQRGTVMSLSRRKAKGTSTKFDELECSDHNLLCCV